MEGQAAEPGAAGLFVFISVAAVSRSAIALDVGWGRVLASEACTLKLK